MDSQAYSAHRRMVKVPAKKRSAHLFDGRSEERPVVLARQDGATTVTQTVIASTMAASATSAPSAAASLPASTAAFAGVAGFFALVLILTGVYCFYRRRNLRSQAKKYKAPSASFDQSAMFEKKNPFAAATLDEPVTVILTPQIALQKPLVTPSSAASSTEDSGWHSATPSALRVKNVDNISVTVPAPPKTAAEKRRPSQSGKQSWRATSHLEEFAGSPPPSYDIANSASHGFLVPLPKSLSPEQSSPMNLIAPAVQKERIPSKKGKAAAKLQSLIVPEHAEPAPIVSPARSESFAPKDLGAQQEASTSSYTDIPLTSGTTSSSSPQGANSEIRTPRLMTVVAPYVPSLADELRVTVGDTVRLMLEYKDGWGLVQYVGKADAPRGVVPLVCLQERRRVVPTIAHKTSNGSVGSSTSWR